ncbi:MAG: hypothetical protein COB02_01610 [Candidatus Cloacimonadota bacterium]|nr:MAG: hypothetical protein COB02_01610 [Candidatus Cloacimonadota bacterium]
MKKLFKTILIFNLLINLSFSELVLIVHKDFPIEKISPKLLKKIYANKIKIWPHGGSIIRTVLRKGKTHKSFCKVLNQTPSYLKRFWKKQVFTGRGPSLKRFISAQDLIIYISTHKNAIGYADSSINNKLIKKITLKIYKGKK